MEAVNSKGVNAAKEEEKNDGGHGQVKFFKGKIFDTSSEYHNGVLGPLGLVRPQVSKLSLAPAKAGRSTHLKSLFNRQKTFSEGLRLKQKKKRRTKTKTSNRREYPGHFHRHHHHNHNHHHHRHHFPNAAPRLFFNKGTTTTTNIASYSAPFSNYGAPQVPRRPSTTVQGYGGGAPTSFQSSKPSQSLSLIHI